MNQTTALSETSFLITAFPVDFCTRVRATGRDAFDRPVQVIVAEGGEPVRDQLRRALPGERIILCSYQSIPLPSTFAEIGPIFIGAEASDGTPVHCDELPPGYFPRPFALRAHNAVQEIMVSEVVDPVSAIALIRDWLARPGVAFLQARFAGNGCFACRIDRPD